MVVPVRFVILIFLIFHSAYGAFAGLVASAALAVHGAHIGRGIFPALLFRFVGIVAGVVATGRPEQAGGH